MTMGALAAAPPPQRQSELSPPQADRANRFAARLFIATLVLAPLPFGSDFPEAVVFWCLCLAISAGLSRTSMLARSRAKILFAIAFLLVIYGGAIVLQMSSIPWLVAPDAVWGRAAKLLHTPLLPTAAIARYQPLYALGPVLANLLSLTLGLVLGAERRRARQILMAFAWSGLAYAVFGIISALVEPGMILWRERPAYYGRVIGTFINRNTAATYFGSCAAIWALLFCESVKRHLGADQLTWKSFSRRILSRARADTAASLTATVVCLMALVMTGSRAGVVISFAGIAGSVAIFLRRDLPKRSSKGWFVAGALCVIIIALQYFGGPVSSHFNISGLADEGRFETYRSTLKIITEHPWLGTGLDSFALAFPQYRSAQTSIFGIWDMAHSTPLQLAAEMGLPVALVVAAAWAGALVILANGILTRQRDAILPLSGAAVAVIALLHSSVDFSLQIPGYAIVAMGMVGMGLAQSFRSHIAD